VLLFSLRKALILEYCQYVTKLSYPARNAHGPYCHSVSARYTIFSELSHSGTILEIKLMSEICVLILFETFVQILSHCKKKRARYDKNYVVLLQMNCLVSLIIIIFLIHCQLPKILK